MLPIDKIYTLEQAYNEIYNENEKTCATTFAELMRERNFPRDLMVQLLIEAYITPRRPFYLEPETDYQPSGRVNLSRLQHWGGTIIRFGRI